MKELPRYGFIAFIAATVMMTFTSIQVHLQMVLRGNMEDWRESFLWNAMIWYSWVPLIPFVVALSFRYPIEKGRRFLPRIALHIFLALAFILLHALIAGALMSFTPDIYGMPSNPARGAIRLLGVQAHWGFMSYVCTVALVHVSIHVRRAQEEVLAREALRTQAVSAQLSALQRQMQPHFLFNSLNALVSMLPEESSAQRFTIRLSDMLRVLLENSDQPTASLAEELALVNAYLEIERARLGSRLRTDIDVIDSLLDFRLPSLTLQPLVENAIRHSISRSLEGGQITVHARRDLEQVHIEVSNTCQGRINGDDSGTGMTLPNCRQRLALMYGPGARFDAGYIGSNLFRASIILPTETTLGLRPV
jgi:two-component system, LytTR family, sensor kinase